ncbi:MAG: hypothetical protein E2600_13390 [Chryseobacterium sp.]|nr:hypothetical protein [Chryseobacterium sp.]
MRRCFTSAELQMREGEGHCWSSPYGKLCKVFHREATARRPTRFWYWEKHWEKRGTPKLY